MKDAKSDEARAADKREQELKLINETIKDLDPEREGDDVLGGRAATPGCQASFAEGDCGG